MYDAIAWSYSLLPTHEQQLFRRLAVFVGGFSLDAAEAVAASEPGAIDPLRDISSLMEQNLLRREDATAAEPRFGMLETIREFAAEHLGASDEAVTIRDRHAAYFLALAEEARPHILGADQVTWLNRLEIELPNVRVALEWLRTQPRIEEALRLVGALGWFWYRRGYYSEARRHLAALFAASAASEPTPARAAALVLAAELATMQGDRDSAAAHGNEALRTWRDLDSQNGAAHALNALGSLAIDQGDTRRAHALLEEAVALQRGVDQWGLTKSLAYLGVADYAQGDYANAAARFAEGLALARAIEDLFLVAQMLGDAGHVALARGQLESAAIWYEEALDLHQRLAAYWDVGWCLAGFAGMGAAIEQPDRAARLYGAAMALHATDRAPMRPSVQQTYDRILEPVRRALGAAGWEAACAAGAALTLDEAIAEAYAVVADIRISTALADAATPATSSAYGLTPREVEVLRLVAAGRSDREIAATLFIGHRTAQDHVSNIIGKLGVANRTEAAAVAVRDGMI